MVIRWSIVLSIALLRLQGPQLTVMGTEADHPLICSVTGVGSIGPTASPSAVRTEFKAAYGHSSSISYLKGLSKL